VRYKFDGTMEITQTFSNFKRLWGRFELCFEFRRWLSPAAWVLPLKGDIWSWRGYHRSTLYAQSFRTPLVSGYLAQETVRVTKLAITFPIIYLNSSFHRLSFPHLVMVVGYCPRQSRRSSLAHCGDHSRGRYFSPTSSLLVSS